MPAGGKPKYSRGSPSYFTSYLAHNLLGQFRSPPFPSEGVCSGIAMAVAGRRFRHELCILDLVSVMIAAGRRAGHVSIRSWRRDRRGPGPAHNLSHGMGRVGRGAARRRLDTCCPTGAQHPIGIGIDIGIGIGVWKWSVATFRGP